MGVLKYLAAFYERYENLGLKITFLLIALQIIHLYWLASDVIFLRLIGESFFAFPQVPDPVFVAIDYLEIPALFTGMVFYALLIYSNRKNGKRVWKEALFIALLTVQAFHLFWITDEIVYETLFGTVPIAIPAWLAWIAILVDYLELPVIWDLFRKVIKKQMIGKV